MTTSPVDTRPEHDLDYSIQDDMPPGTPTLDSQFVFARMPDLIAQKATSGGAKRVLDVGAGFGGQMDLLRQYGAEAWGLDASREQMYYCTLRFADDLAPVLCGVAEALPFRDNSFDAVVCQGSLDHFATPDEFIAECARILKPGGHAVIAISNYDSLSCRVGRGLYRMKERLGRDVYRGRNYWQIPANHTFKGTYDVLRRIGGKHLELVECRGISLMWLFRTWTRLMDALPRSIAWPALRAVDKIAYRAPALADVVVSVWRPRGK
jgi:SAM-dependent methyltransferase